MKVKTKLELFKKLIFKWGLDKFIQKLKKRYEQKMFRFYITKLYKIGYFNDLINELKIMFNINKINNIDLIKYFENGSLEQCVQCKTYFSNNEQRLHKFCSVKCSNIFNNSLRKGIERTPEIKEKIKKIINSDKVRTKIINKNLEKYGVKWAVRSKEVQDKIKSIKLERYGHEYYNNHEKAKQTCLEKYGSYTNREKAKQTCLEKYGKEYFDNSEILRERSREKYKDIKNFVVDGFFDLQKCMDYYGVRYPGIILQYKKEFNIIEPNKNEKCRTQQNFFNKINTSEKILNARDIINKELDIFLPKVKLAIEYNGLMFHSQGFSGYSMFNTPNYDKKYHLNKTLECKSKGIQLFHIFEGENTDLWLSMIHNKLGLNKKIYARKCFIKELKSNELIEFLNENHLQGFINSSINLGLYHNSTLVACMTFSKPRFNKDYDYELIRFCSLRGHNVIGGASKLFKYFIKKYQPKNIISYANRRFSNGKIYETLGFNFLRETEPNYFYFKEGSNILESRNKYQKHKLSSLLENYDELLSEVENMFVNGYRRIFDCGNLVYEYTNNQK